VIRTRLIAGVAILSLFILSIAGTIFLRREWNGKQARLDKRFPLAALNYCNSDQVTPCVVSFGLDAEGNMLVSFLTTGAFYPDFYLKIKTEAGEYTYICQKTYKFATSVYCTGKAMPVGQALQFLIFSLNDEVLLAQGTFPIIGMSLVTPADFSPPTETPTPTPTGAFTPEATPSPSYPSYPVAPP
jgi:hypothetical protein